MAKDESVNVNGTGPAFYTPTRSNDGELIELFAALHSVASQCMLHVNPAKERR